MNILTTYLIITTTLLYTLYISLNINKYTIIFKIMYSGLFSISTLFMYYNYTTIQNISYVVM